MQKHEWLHSNPALDRRRGIFTSSPIYLKKMKTKKEIIMKLLNESIRTRKDLASYCKIIKAMPGSSIAIENEGGMNALLKNKNNYNIANLECHTFKEWKNLGFSILKGSRAYTLWSAPKEIKIKNDDDKVINKKDKEDEHEMMYFICKLFTSKQVKKNEEK